MTNEEAERGFLEALKEYGDPRNDLNMDAARFFFFAGAEFGARQVAEIHNIIYKEPKDE